MSNKIYESPIYIIIVGRHHTILYVIFALLHPQIVVRTYMLDSSLSVFYNKICFQMINNNLSTFATLLSSVEATLFFLYDRIARLRGPRAPGYYIGYIFIFRFSFTLIQL